MLVKLAICKILICKLTVTAGVIGGSAHLVDKLSSPWSLSQPFNYTQLASLPLNQFEDLHSHVSTDTLLLPLPVGSQAP